MSNTQSIALRLAALILLAGLSTLTGCDQHHAPQHTTNPQVAPEATETPPLPQAAPIRPEFSSLEDAIDGTRSEMGDTVDDISHGAAILALWSAKNLRWSDLQDIPLTKVALVMKDSEEQRGKRICVLGTIIEIASEKAQQSKFYNGGIYDRAGNLYRFLAVRSTGDLVANSPATFCGIVTGREDYSNSVGGTAHSVMLVGMFSLPENK